MAEHPTTSLRPSAALGLGEGAVRLREITDRAFVTLVTTDAAVRERLEGAFGVALPRVGDSVVTERGERLLGLQADRLYVMFDTLGDPEATADPERALLARIDARIDDLAATRTDAKATGSGAARDTPAGRTGEAGPTLLYSSDQSDSWAVLHLDGPLARRVLERLCPLDLHPDVHPLGAVARSVAEHLGVIVLREDEDAFLLLSPRSSAHDFLDEIETSIEHLRHSA